MSLGKIISAVNAAFIALIPKKNEFESTKYSYVYVIKCIRP